MENPMLFHAKDQRIKDLTKPNGIASRFVSAMPREGAPEVNPHNDTPTEQQIIDLISEGCPNTQGY